MNLWSVIWYCQKSVLRIEWSIITKNLKFYALLMPLTKFCGIWDINSIQKYKMILEYLTLFLTLRVTYSFNKKYYICVKF